MISLKEFKNYKEILESTITNKAFRSRLMFEAIDDESFFESILNYYRRLNNNLTSESLDRILDDIRYETIKYYELSTSEMNLEKKTKLALRSLAYFYFLESIDEHSIFSDNVIEQIKQRYPNDYLEIISKIDKIYLSVDTKKKIKSVENELVTNDELLKKYIILKQWQDKQHHFFDNGYGKYLEDLQTTYCDDNTMDSFSLEQFTLRKRLFDTLSKKKILDLDTCSILSELYIKKFVVKFIGGKMYGLSVLNSKGIKVPFSMVVPIGVEVTADDLQIFDNKFSHYSVRSSADIEDGEKNSFAGMFDSYLNVLTKDILKNIHKVKQSISSERLKEYILVNGLDQPHMAVVIQSFKESTHAGVWIGNSDNSGVLEWVDGNGEKLVSGASTPHSEIWNDGKCANSLELNGQPIGKKMLEFQQKVGSDADFEWMILDDELIMLQFRPVTQKVIVSNEYGNSNSNGISGIPAAPGFVSGKGRFLNSPSEEIVADKILLAMMTDPDWVPHLMNCKGAITAYGGFLCHTAIVCRELGIPCVTGVGEEALDELSNQDKIIEVNGNNGNVKILEIKKEFSINETRRDGESND